MLCRRLSSDFTIAIQSSSGHLATKHENSLPLKRAATPFADFIAHWDRKVLIKTRNKRTSGHIDEFVSFLLCFNRAPTGCRAAHREATICGQVSPEAEALGSEPTRFIWLPDSPASKAPN
jgi:hypothetical protein